MRMDALLLAETPNIDTLVKMTPSFAKHLESPAIGSTQSGGSNAKVVAQALETLWDPTVVTVSSVQSFGDNNSDDVETIEAAIKYITNEGDASTMEVHLNGALRAGSNDIDAARYQAAISKVDSLLSQLVAAMKDSATTVGAPKSWTALLCMDSSTSETGNCSGMLQYAPAVLTDTPVLEEEAEVALTIPETIFWGIMAISLLYGFLFGLDLMGSSFKVLGGKSAGALFTSINNPVAGLMVGILATVLVQSSSTSTSVVVGMVGADIITVENAIPIIMGANIGTSVTNTIVSMGQMGDQGQYKRAFAGATVHDSFNMLCVIIFLPLEVCTHMLKHWTELLTSELSDSDGGKFKSPLKIIVSPLTKLFLEIDKKKINKIAEGKLNAAGMPDAGSLTKGGWFGEMDDELGGGLCLAISLIVLCFCLYGIVVVLQKLVMGNAKQWIKDSLAFTGTWWGGYLAMLVGMGATIAVQSSSITTSTLTPLVGIGIITLEQMLPLTLGANIGTTCTGLLAAMVSSKKSALQIALAHLSFNCFGIMVWYPFEVMRQVPLNMAKNLGYFAWHFKWFPIAYILTMFVLMPCVILGISQLFDSGAAGIAFGTILCLIIFGGLCFAVYAYYNYGGKEFLAELASDAAIDEHETVALESVTTETPTEATFHTSNDFKLDVEENKVNNVA